MGLQLPRHVTIPASFYFSFSLSSNSFPLPQHPVYQIQILLSAVFLFSLLLLSFPSVEIPPTVNFLDVVLPLFRLIMEVKCEAVKEIEEDLSPKTGPMSHLSFNQ